MAFVAPSTLLTPTGFDRAAIARAAWALARHRAARDDLPLEFGFALSQMWSQARIEAQRAGRESKVRGVSSFVASAVELYGTTGFGRAA